MNEQQKQLLFLEIRKNVHDIVKTIFDELDKEVASATFKKEDIQLIRASRIRMTMKNLRYTTLKSIKEIGKDIGIEPMDEDDLPDNAS